MEDFGADRYAQRRMREAFDADPKWVEGLAAACGGAWNGKWPVEKAREMAVEYARLGRNNCDPCDPADLRAMIADGLDGEGQLTVRFSALAVFDRLMAPVRATALRAQRQRRWRARRRGAALRGRDVDVYRAPNGAPYMDDLTDPAYEMDDGDCAHCDTHFERRRIDQIYCSSKCRVAAHRQAARDRVPK